MTLHHTGVYSECYFGEATVVYDDGGVPTAGGTASGYYTNTFESFSPGAYSDIGGHFYAENIYGGMVAWTTSWI
jgi:hypothetical protein